ncbi:MAG: gliding motility-associated C-terminal domain-containing protein, partial [Saprospiraceae bacterium]|nr:gliding motility-associated C-terminal domain-containing protein [Saprospiraceae bacterium]
ITFDVADGVAPFFISGNTGAFTGTQFVSDPIAFGTGYTFILRDTFNCAQDTITGTSPCSCPTMAGTMNQTPLLLCDGAAATFSAPTGTNLGTGDVLVYYLVSSGTSPGAWTVVDSSATPTFNYNSNTITNGTTYFVFAVAGNPQGAGIDPADPCISVAVGPTVTWRPAVTATLSGDTIVCQGASISLNVDFTGLGFYTLNYTANGVANSVSTSSNPFPLIPMNPTGTTTYVLTGVTGQGGCVGTVSGSATVTVSSPPQALNAQTTCDFATETFVLTFEVSNGVAPNSTYTITGVTGTLTDTSFVSDPIPSGSYNVTITNADGCSSTLSGSATCVCTTDAGTMSNALLNICLPGQASAAASVNTMLDANDALQYILYENVALLPQGILATSNTPQFGLQTGMTVETTYYIAAMAGNGLPNGSVDINDPCLSISNGRPIVFHNAPAATLMGTDTVCPGGSAAFQIAFTGNAPFQFVYAINNNNQPQLSAPGATFNITTSNIQAPQAFTLVSVQDAFCPGTVSGQANVQVRPAITASIINDVTICAGNTATLTLVLGGGTSYNVTVGGGAAPIQLSNVANGAQFDVSPAVTTTYSVTTVTASGNNCPSTIGQGATVTLTSLIGNATLSDFNGFNVSCANENDGSISIVTTGGVPPITALWSTGDSGLQLGGLIAGDYSVVLSDQIGCVDSATFTLTAPPGVLVDFSTIIPRCFGERNGTITIQSVTGGADPYMLTLNSVSMSPDTFPVRIGQLASGSFTLEVEDANGCLTTEEIDVAAPAELIVNVGPDQNIALGDSTILEGLTNALGIDTFIWSPITFLSNPDSLITYVKPENSQVYTLLVRDTFGCSGRDEMLLTVRRDSRIFIPNIIKSGSAENESLTVYGGPELESIRSLRVYDRWGELLFEGLDIPKNDPSVGWKGRAKNKDVMPGVYIFVVEVVLIDGTTEILTGDVTVVR